jgi:hypothetical protein
MNGHLGYQMSYCSIGPIDFSARPGYAVLAAI